MLIGTVICVIRNSIRTSLPFRSYLLTGYRNVSFACVCLFAGSTSHCFIVLLQFFRPFLPVTSSPPLIADRPLPHQLLVNCIRISYLYLLYLPRKVLRYLLNSQYWLHLV